MSLHKEISFEDEICGHLAAHGWLHVEGDAALYERPRALFAPDLIAWAQATQNTAWDALAKNHGAGAQGVLFDRVRKQLDDRGTLDVLRHGVELIGLRRPIALAQFKPAMAMNPDIVARYAANRLRITVEPLLGFPSGALVHFAVSNSEVHMTTQLAGPATRFLPFNKGGPRREGQPAEPSWPPHELSVGRSLAAR